MISTTITTNKIDNENKLCAAVSVFKNLYDSKNDIRDVLAIFINYIVAEKAIHVFTAHKIKEYLHNEFYFDIPESVLKTIMKKRLGFTLENGEFIVGPESRSPVIDKDEINKQFDDASKNNNIILEDLLRYAETTTKQTFNETDIIELYENLYGFLMNKSVINKYAPIVSAYIISIECDANKRAIISNIREGIILYEGIKYTSNLNELTNWDKKLSVFCDVDILFSLYGLNGVLYQELMNDLIQLVKESNARVKNKIQLFYFSKTKQEIETYFNRAQIILETKEIINPSKTAMVSILNGCDTTSDVIRKKAEFYVFLRRMGIVEYKWPINFYDTEENRKYVLFSEEKSELILKRFPGTTIEYVHDCFEYISYINALREGKNIDTFEQSEYIFLTSNGKTLHIAYSMLSDNEDGVSKAVNPDFLINKLWFKMNKGLGEKVLSSFNIISKAKIVLASQLNSKIAMNYDRLCEDINNGSTSPEVATNTLVELKRIAKNPEDINSDSLDSSVDFLVSEDCIQNRVNEHSVLEEKYRDAQNNLIVMEQRNEEKDKMIRLYEEELYYYREKDKQHKQKKEKQQARTGRLLRGCIIISIAILVIVGCCVLGNFLNEKRIQISGWILGTIAFVMGVLAFMGIDYKRIIKWLKKDK